MRILLVEDDPGIGRFVSKGLAGEGYEVEWATTGRAALEAMRAGGFAACILDVGLPDTDGFELCRAARAEGFDAPILMLTARGSLDDKLDGFRSGADDYLAKPFAFEELVARLAVAARRGAAAGTQVLAAGPLGLDLRAKEARLRGAPMALTRREFDVLACLARKPGQPVSRQEILDQVWGADADLTENSVDVYIGYLRRHFAALPGAPAIETVRGVGFRLMV